MSVDDKRPQSGVTGGPPSITPDNLPDAKADVTDFVMSNFHRVLGPSAAEVRAAKLQAERDAKKGDRFVKALVEALDPTVKLAVMQEEIERLRELVEGKEEKKPEPLDRSEFQASQLRDKILQFAPKQNPIRFETSDPGGAWSEQGARIDKLESDVGQHAVSLSTKAAKHEKKLDDFAKIAADLLARVAALEDDSVVAIEPVPLKELIESADNRVKKLTDLERLLDAHAWPIFDAHEKLKRPGGFYDLAFLTEDIDEACEGLSTEDAVATAMRWAKKRSSWMGNTNFWVRPVEEAHTLVLQRNRFIFQVKNPPPEALFIEE